MVCVDLSVLFLMKRHLCSVYVCIKGIVLGIFPCSMLRAVWLSLSQVMLLTMNEEICDESSFC